MDNDSNRRISVFSEIGDLETVLLHRPGREISNLHPDHLERLLFDDVPDLDIAQREHDAFAYALKSHGTTVIYLEELMAETLSLNKGLRDTFVNQFLSEANLESKEVEDKIRNHIAAKSDRDLVDTLISGVRATDINVTLKESYPLACDPLPNLYFTRDPFATMGHGITINCMRTATRRRETIFAQYIFDNHPNYKGDEIKRWYSRGEGHSIEGGDELILSAKTLAIGVSQRTDLESVKKVAKNIFNAGTESFEEVLAFIIPAKRAFMHLDTVFTQADYDKFLIHPEIKGPLQILYITKEAKNSDSEFDKEFGVYVTKVSNSIENILSEVTGHDVKLLSCANGDPIDAAREQWSDGSNVLAVSPGKIIVYERNRITAKQLEKAGLDLLVIPSSELSRGRGGPRCMSMPLKRKALK